MFQYVLNKIEICRIQLTNTLQMCYNKYYQKLQLRGVEVMADKKLVISSKKFRGDSSVVSVRLPNDMIEKLDAIAEQTGRTRNEIIQKCLAYSIENIEVTDNK